MRRRYSRVRRSFWARGGFHPILLIAGYALAGQGRGLVAAAVLFGRRPG